MKYLILSFLLLTSCADQMRYSYQLMVPEENKDAYIQYVIDYGTQHAVFFGLFESRLKTIKRYPYEKYHVIKCIIEARKLYAKNTLGFSTYNWAGYKIKEWKPVN